MKLLLFWNLYYFAGADLGGRGARAPFQNIMKFYQRQKKEEKEKENKEEKKNSDKVLFQLYMWRVRVSEYILYLSN